MISCLYPMGCTVSVKIAECDRAAASATWSGSLGGGGKTTNKTLKKCRKVGAVHQHVGEV